MNLIHGQLADAKQAEAAMRDLPRDLARTLCALPPDPNVVITACDELARALPREAALAVLGTLGFSPAEAARRLTELRLMFSRDYLEARMETELGPGWGSPRKRRPHGLGTDVEEHLMPLGVLFHIAAGNMDGLPVLTVIEGLLSGNVNLLKLSAADGGLSVMVLQMLFELAPVLADYVYVFDLSSSETEPLRQLAQLADGIVIWGGDEAVAAARQLAPPNARLIEWGHKLSFAYVTKSGMKQPKLAGLAHHICQTEQLLCSSCQGILLDTDDRRAALEFCGEFSRVLDSVSAEYPPVPLHARAQSTLVLYTRELEAIYGDAHRAFRGAGGNVVFSPDNALEASLQFRNPWVKCLPRADIIPRLHPYKGYLQTAALLCGPTEWAPLRDALWRAGVARVCAGADMSTTFCGAAHDGDYPLRRYMRVVSAQK